MIGMIQRLSMRLAMHITLCMNLYHPALFSSKADMESVRAAYLTRPIPATAVPDSSVKGKAKGVMIDTPVKSNQSSTLSKATSTPSLAAASASTSAVGSLMVTMKESIHLTLDTHHYLQYLHSDSFAEYVLIQSSGLLTRSIWSRASQHVPGEQAMIKLFHLLWKHITSSIVIECKKAFVAVKAIAGKYRMTNKAAPTSASSYVATILTPLRRVECQTSDTVC
jgi:hypothetical protein